MTIQLSDHFTYKKLLRFCFPPIVMMMFTSIYGVVDGLFVSNFVGKIPFAAINLVMPFVMILGGFGFMIGTGGSALVAKTLGENDKERANRYFTMMIQLTLCLGCRRSVYPAHLLPARGHRFHDRGLRFVRPGGSELQHGLYAAKCVSNFFGGR